MSEFQIVELVPSDVEASVEVVRTHSRVDADLAKKYFDTYHGGRSVRQSERRRAYVAKDTKGRVIGVVSCQPDKYEWEGILWLGWLFVLSEWQGTGVANAERILQDARRWSIRKIYLDTSSDELYVRALAFYAKMGFIQEARLRDYYEPGEDYLILGMVVDPA